MSGKPAIFSREVTSVTLPEIGELPHVRVVGLDASEASAAMLDFAQRLPEVAAMGLKHQASLQEFLSWRRIAESHLQQYERVCGEAS